MVPVHMASSAHVLVILPDVIVYPVSHEYVATSENVVSFEVMTTEPLSGATRDPQSANISKC